MRFYRVEYFTDGGSSGGFTWHTSVREAQAEELACKEDGCESNVTVVDVERLNKRTLLILLNQYASHPNNG